MCVRLVQCYDPDGPEPDDEQQQRRRFFDACAETDCLIAGSYRLARVEGARLMAFLGAHAALRPTDDPPDLSDPLQRSLRDTRRLVSLAAE